jgi:four helix bundle protein
MNLSEDVYRLSLSWPKAEIYGLTSQARRAAVSVPANIAESYGRQGTASYVQFLKIASGSLKELETILLLAERVRLATRQFRGGVGTSRRTRQMLGGLIRNVPRRP